MRGIAGRYAGVPPRPGAQLRPGLPRFFPAYRGKARSNAYRESAGGSRTTRGATPVLQSRAELGCLHVLRSRACGLLLGLPSRPSGATPAHLAALSRGAAAGRTPPPAPSPGRLRRLLLPRRSPPPLHRLDRRDSLPVSANPPDPAGNPARSAPRTSRLRSGQIFQILDVCVF